MQNVITVATMRDSDAHTIAEYTPSRELMHRAALGVYQAADWTGKTVAILTGGGNNGRRRLCPGGHPGREGDPLPALPSLGEILGGRNILLRPSHRGRSPGGCFYQGNGPVRL